MLFHWFALKELSFHKASSEAIAVETKVDSGSGDTDYSSHLGQVTWCKISG